MAMRNLTVTFHTNVYSKSWKGFQFPEPLARLLGRKKGQRFTLALTIEKLNGEVVFHAPRRLLLEPRSERPASSATLNMARKYV